MMNLLFFKLAFRSLLKNRLNTFINILGFSLGIAASLFIFLFINYENSFDNFHPNRERIYRVMGAFNMADGVNQTGFGWFPTAPAVKNGIPGVEDFCRVTESTKAKCYNNGNLYKLGSLRSVDDNFFHFFNFQLLNGNPETVLNSADKIVLTEEKAKHIFGNKNPLGEPLLYNHKVFTVSGIAANPPSNTQFAFDALTSVKYIEQSDEYWKGWGGGITFLSYILLERGIKPEQIENALPALLQQEVNQYWEKEGGMTLSAKLQNIEDVHLSDGTIAYDVSSARNKKSLTVVASISLLILLLAVINYIILYTAQIISKIKDNGILKIHGAGKRGLFAQTYAEVFIIAGIASLLGILSLTVGLNFLNTHLHTAVSVSQNIVIALVFLAALIFVLSTIVTLISTRKILATNPIDSIKNNTISGSSRNTQANFLVTFQFAAVILLLISVFVVSRQNKFLLNHELGFDKENILTLYSDEEFLNKELEGFKQQLKSRAEIRSVSLSSQPVGTGITQNGYSIGDESNKIMINALYTDADFLNCFDIKLLSGENFSGNESRDNNAILINQELAKKVGWDNPLDKTINRDGDLKIIGVVKDFNFSSLSHQIRPVLIMANPDWDGWGYSVINIRYQTTDIQALVKQIGQMWQKRFPETPYEIGFLDDMLASNYKSLEAQQKIISFFSLLGMIIAVVGLFGLTVFVTKKRIKEIGIRKVNGAKISEVIVMLNKDFVKWVAIAFVLATPIAYYAMHKWLENFAYKTTLSWWIFALAGALALGIALLTVSWQSWRAATRNPVEALRYE
nr:ABC transporter permease [uncultured Draconibacterium sp.]